MMTVITSVLVVLVCVFFFILSYSINQKVPVPEECKIAMEDSGCHDCSNHDSCVTKDLVKNYFKDKENEEK